MAITFFTQSTKDPAPIYVRIREGKNIDAKARTKFSINPERLDKNKIKLHRTPQGANAITKQEIKEANTPLIELQSSLDYLKSSVSESLNNRKDYEVINSDWLKKIVNPPQEITPTLLTDYFDFYLKDKKSSLRHSTVKKLGSIKSRLLKYEKDKDRIYLAEVNQQFKHKLSKWFDENGYAHNTKVKTLKVIVTICNHAQENGVKIHPEAQSISKNLKYKDTPHVYLTFEDLQKIEKVKLEQKQLDIARDWLLISCHTAQRVSDFMRFSKKDIITIEDMKFLDIKQEKTGQPIYIPLNETVLKILKKYNGNFPPLFSENKDSNAVVYNDLIKKVCQKAKIREMVKANLRQTKKNRYEIKEVPKWKAVSTHIGRRSFATNYYGKIPTALLIGATGHATEKQFLTYVGKKPQNQALELAKALKRVSIEQGKEPQLEFIKNASNG